MLTNPNQHQNVGRLVAHLRAGRKEIGHYIQKLPLGNIFGDAQIHANVDINHPDHISQRKHLLGDSGASEVLVETISVLVLGLRCRAHERQGK
jgi:hypothetical protein